MKAAAATLLALSLLLATPQGADAAGTTTTHTAWRKSPDGRCVAALTITHQTGRPALVQARFVRGPQQCHGQAQVTCGRTWREHREYVRWLRSVGVPWRLIPPRVSVTNRIDFGRSGLRAHVPSQASCRIGGWVR